MGSDDDDKEKGGQKRLRNGRANDANGDEPDGDDAAAAWERLPDEIVVHIMSFVPCAVLCARAVLVCRRWAGLIAGGACRTCVGPAHAQEPLDPCAWAAAASHSHCIEWAIRSGCPSTCEALEAALWSRAGNEDRRMDVIARLVEADAGRTPHACRIAAGAGNLVALAYLRNHGYTWDKSVCAAAAAEGRLDCLRYAHENGCPWGKTTPRDAASGGHLACLRYAREAGCPWSESVCTMAARCDSLDCLAYAHENGCPWDGRVCTAAAENGHLTCLVYARERGCPWDGRTCSAAASNGHLGCLKYAHERGCPWDRTVCARAAFGGHVECLKYARERNCPWDQETILCALAGRRVECLAYAHERGCAWPSPRDDRPHRRHGGLVLRSRGGNDADAEMLACLEYARGCAADPPAQLWTAIIDLSMWRSLAFWARAFPLPDAQHTYVAAMGRRRWDLVDALIDARAPWNALCCIKAAHAGRDDVLSRVHSGAVPLADAEYHGARCSAHHAAAGPTVVGADEARLADLAVIMHRSGCGMGRAMCIDSMKTNGDWGLAVATACGMDIADAVARCGIKIIDRALRLGVRPTAAIRTKVIKSGNIGTLRRVIGKDDPPSSKDIADACEEGELGVVIYLARELGWGHGAPPTEARTDERAAPRIRATDPLWRAGIESAVRKGHLDIVRYLHETCGCRFGASLFEAAAERGHADIVNYLRTRWGHAFDRDFCTRAAARGQKRAIACAREHGARWDGGTCAAAAAGGHVDLLRYLVDQGCPWDERTYEAALAAWHPDDVARCFGDQGALNQPLAQ
jgi:hypothetical protein